ncbi:MAG: hypothetical protein GY936_04075 [Ignavibacteriae bacterium]|nr:hypothetical protein [Ignavibacteriota bacterium]
MKLVLYFSNISLDRIILPTKGFDSFYNITRCGFQRLSFLSSSKLVIEAASIGSVLDLGLLSLYTTIGSYFATIIVTTFKGHIKTFIFKKDAQNKFVQIY